MSFASRKRYHVCYNQRSVPNQYLNFTYNHMTIFWCRIHLWFRWMGVCTQSRWRHSVTMPSQDGGYVLLWQRYDNNKMVDMCYYGNVILHLQQYSHRLNLLYFFYISLSLHVSVPDVLPLLLPTLIAVKPYVFGAESLWNW